MGSFDRINHTVLVNIIREKIHDNRFIRLLENLLAAGYLEDWRYHMTLSGVPQGSVVSPILSNLVLDRLDKFVEQTLIPANTRGDRRKTNPPYVALTKAAWKARKSGELASAYAYNRLAQTIPSRDPNDPNFRRLWYSRYADDFLLGFTGPKTEAEDIKRQLTVFLQDELRLELSAEKTLITHARNEKANFLGYEIHTLHADDKHDQRGQRCINGAIGLRVPKRVIKAKCAKYTRNGKPAQSTQLINNSDYSIVAQYQTEYVGIVQYYRLAYNLHELDKLKRVTELSLVKTLARKYKTTCTKIYKRYRALHQTEQGTYKVLRVVVNRGSEQKPLETHFGGIPLRWNKWVTIGEEVGAIWSHRSELVERLLAQRCELCGATEKIEVHHIRKLADVEQKGRVERPKWMQLMAARRRKTLIVCQNCHHEIQYGRYDGRALAPIGHWRAT